MGILIEGNWHDVPPNLNESDGRFVRKASAFRNWITADGRAGPSGGDGFPAEPGRYRLYVSLACPWAHRTLIFRKLKGLDALIPVSVTHWLMADDGWTFEPAEGVVPDPVHHVKALHELYVAAEPGYSGRATVPLLWDCKRDTIVNNESAEIIRMLNSAFDGVGATPGDYCPSGLLPAIDAINERIYDTLNNGVYKAGFATTQAAYETAGPPVRNSRLARGAAGQAALPMRRQRHRGRLATLHDADPFRLGLLHPLQVQPAPAGGLSEPVGVHARPVPVAWHRADGEFRAHQKALLPEPPQHQSHRHRAAGAAPGSRRTVRTLRRTGGVIAARAAAVDRQRRATRPIRSSCRRNALPARRPAPW